MSTDGKNAKHSRRFTCGYEKLQMAEKAREIRKI
jgi:hypothetical protein